MRFVFDSNVIIAAFASRGLCNSIFEICLEKYTIVVSDEILKEVSKALKKKIKIPQKGIDKINSYLIEVCDVCKFNKSNIIFSRDKNDNHIIELALSSKVNYIISGDEDLLILKEIKGIKIINPRKVWDIIRKSK